MYDSHDEHDEAELRRLEAENCSYGDTVHYMAEPKFFERCEGSFMYDREGRPYLDLQMWYSAVNFGYRNPRLNAVAHQQLDRMPQIASQYLHREKIELATRIARYNEEKFGHKGRVHFNVGGAQAVEDALKIVRNAKGGKSLMFAFEGGYHGRTLGASSITSAYRYRRRYGHFGEKAHLVPFPYCFRCPYGMKRDSCDLYCVKQFERLFESEFQGVWDPKAQEAEYAAFFMEVIQGTGGYIVPPEGYFPALQKILEQRKILVVDDEVQMGVFRAGKLWAAEHFGLKPDVVIFGKSITNGLNPLSGVWAREELINPEMFPPGSTHSTFNSNPMGTSVALEVFKMMTEGDYESMTEEKGAMFLEGLKSLQARYPQIGHVDGMGMALRAEICQADGFTPNKPLLDRMAQEGLKGDLEVDGKRWGLILNIGGYHKNVITIAPPLTISREEIDLSIKLLDAVLARCLAD